MGYVPLDNIVRSAIANKGHDTLHLYVPYLHWAFAAIIKFQKEPVYTDIRYKKDFLDENNALPFPEDMLMWNKVGVIDNGRITWFVNDDRLSLDPQDANSTSTTDVFGLFSFDSSSQNLLYSTNIYVSTDKGIVQVNFARGNTFRANWGAKKFQFGMPVAGKQVYIEYVARAHNPSTQTLVNEIASEYFESFIYFREARFRFGAAHRETRAAELYWLDEQDELRGALSDLTAGGIISALNQGTNYTIDQ